MIQHLEGHFGPESVNRLKEAEDPGPDGALAVLESFYYAINRRDSNAMREVWAQHPLTQIDNPIGGILRGGDAAVALYDRLFAGPLQFQFTLLDVVAYFSQDHALFAGREHGHYAKRPAEPVILEIRTSRYFRYEGERWAQYHHHGSIDDPVALAAYQKAVAS
jgi:limonene-1,2-epoxide hydrolase